MTELLGDGMARIDMAGVSKAVSVALVENVEIGDFVVVHVGYALSKIDADEAERTLALLRDAAAMETPS